MFQKCLPKVPILIQSVLCSSVMEKLPATSYVRMVDIWLIFVQLMPFIEVLIYVHTCPLCKNVFEKVTLTTVAELYNEGDNAVNHHGFARQVEREGNESEKKVQNISKM